MQLPLLMDPLLYCYEISIIVRTMIFWCEKWNGPTSGASSECVQFLETAALHCVAM